jgi:hypothetical protein
MPDDEGAQDAPARKRQPRKGKAGAATRHLRPELAAAEDRAVELLDNPGFEVDISGPVLDQQELDIWEEQLAKLREPFPPERIEKLPKPMWGGAWDGESKSQCSECGGYHVRVNTIHLDYVGHANCTDRLLEVDPLWNWEPMALTEAGLPLFSDGGLWIKLTVCGVTRIGFGDGKSVKEVIGDAIRNAAMRFGVALDLWAKINLHEERNPGDGPSPQQRQDRGVRNGGDSRNRGSDQQPPPQPDPAPNQEALDELASVCDRHGYDRRSCGPMFKEWAEQQEHRVNPRLIDADADDIRLFAASLVVMATTEPDVSTDTERSSVQGELGEGAGGDTEVPGATEQGRATDGTGDEDASDPGLAGDMVPVPPGTADPLSDDPPF